MGVAFPSRSIVDGSPDGPASGREDLGAARPTEIGLARPAEIGLVLVPRLPPSRARRAVAWFVRTYLTADLRSLAAGRIVLASVLLLDLVKRWVQLGSWYTNDGLVPNHTLLWRPSFAHVFSFFYMASYTHEAALGFVVCALAYTALLLGVRTRWAQVASTICMMSLHGRVLLFDNGGDVVLGLLCIWTTFLPTGRLWSVDAVLARRRPRELRVVSLAVLAVTCQLAFVYFFNAVHKSGETWRD